MDTKNNSPAANAYWSYTRAFAALDPREVARHFQTPALLIEPSGTHALPDTAAVEQLYRKVISDIPKRYARTEFHSFNERRLGEGLSVVSGTGSWVDKEGVEFMPFGFTYTMAKSGDAWRIVVAVIHDANAPKL